MPVSAAERKITEKCASGNLLTCFVDVKSKYDRCSNDGLVREAPIDVFYPNASHILFEALKNTKMVQAMPQSKRLVLFGGLALTLGLPLLHANQFGEWFFGLSPLQSRDLFWWPLLVVTLLYVLLIEKRPLSTIGLRKPELATLVLVAGTTALILFAVDPLISFIVTALHLSGNATPNQMIDATPYWYRALLVTRAALAEEVVFRGYLIERIEELSGSRILAGAVSLAAFALAHLAYWGWVPLVGVSLIGLVLTVLYQWRRDLCANIAVHWLVDAAQLLVP